MRLSSVQKGRETLRLTYAETRQENQQAEVPRHHLAAKLNLIAPSKAPQNALPKKWGMTQHVVGEVQYDSGSPSTVKIKGIITEKCRFA